MRARLRKPPGGDRTWYALLNFLGGAYLMILPYWRSSVQDWVLVAGLFLLVIGTGMWRKQRWSDYATLLVVSLITIYWFHASVSNGFNLVRLAFFGCGCWCVWEVWKLCRERPAPLPDNADKQPLISLVLFLKEPRYLEAPVLANILESAWGTPFSAGSEEGDGSKHYVVGESPLFMVGTPEAMFIVHNHARQYFDDTQAVLEDIREMRIRKAIEDHQAWLAVDLMRSFDDSRPAESYYPQIARLVAELAGPDCLALFQPEASRINPWDDTLHNKLLSAEPLAAVNEVSKVPVIQMASDDPRMVAAVAEARRRWPEFVAAFKERKPGDHFAVKAPVTHEERTEFIWIEVIGLEPEYIHGTLGNDPVDLGDLKFGDQVEVPLKDLNDWLCIRNGGEPEGMFTTKVIRQAQAGRNAADKEQ